MTDSAERRETIRRAMRPPTSEDSQRGDEAPTVRLVIEWDAQSPEQDEALVEEITDELAGGWLEGYRPSWSATFPQKRADEG